MYHSHYVCGNICYNHSNECTDPPTPEPSIHAYWHLQACACHALLDKLIKAVLGHWLWMSELHTSGER